MSNASRAVAEPNSNSPEPLDTIEKAIQNKFKENFKPSEKYKLRFTFEGTDNKTKEYSTNFKFNYSGITNNCITISYKNDIDATEVSSMIQSNTRSRNCFTPNLYIEGNLPKDITQTDILQVLNTKLKIILRYPDEDITLTDAAAVKDSEDVRISAPFSNWRVVRGEKPIYAKYGYESEEFYIISRFARENHWRRIEDKEYKGKKIKDLWIAVYPCVEIGYEDSIAAVMKKMGDRQSEKSSEIVMAVFKTIINELASSSHSGYSRMFPNITAIFTLNKDSSEWKKWDKLLKIKSFEPDKLDANSNNEGNLNNGKSNLNNGKSNEGNTSNEDNSMGGSRVCRTRRKYKKVLRKKIKSRSTKRRK
jgi:hypothetical protein